MMRSYPSQSTETESERIEQFVYEPLPSLDQLEAARTIWRIISSHVSDGRVADNDLPVIV